MTPGTGRSENVINGIWRLLLRLALLAVIFFALYRLRNIITTLFVAAIIAYVLDPLVEWLCRQRGFVQFHSGLSAGAVRIGEALRRVLAPSTPPAPAPVPVHRHVARVYATIYVFLFAILVVWQGARLIVTPFVAEFRAATSPAGRRQAVETKKRVLDWYDEHAPTWARSDKVQEQINKSHFLDYVSTIAAQAGQHVLESLKNIIDIVLLPVLAFYFLIDGRKLKHEFVSLLPRSRIPEALRILREFNRIMRAFVVGQFILCLLAGVVVGAGLALLQVRYPIILGVVAGLTRAIPIIGPIVGGIPIVLLALVTKGFGVGLAVLAFFTFLHFAESKFIMPMIIGDRMELHPVVIIVVLLIGGEVGGLLIGGQIGALLGMFFAAPVAAIIRVLVRRYWLHVRARPSRGLPPAPLAEPAESLSTPHPSEREEGRGKREEGQRLHPLGSASPPSQGEGELLP
ncbi:MAG TPA: AI-2E family transporter [Chthonomonadaceae bacterium]|nr:AI-2E family transporter [Chthonomonadaceae bacterium]